MKNILNHLKRLGPLTGVVGGLKNLLKADGSMEIRPSIKGLKLRIVISRM